MDTAKPNSIYGIKDCYGCGVCATVCPKKIIDIKLNCSGFYEPAINDIEACTNCGACQSVCSIKDSNLSVDNEIVASYAAWSNNADVRHKCSSGGVGYEIGRHLLKDGYKVCAVRYNAQENRAEHFIATNEEELTASMGSKYIQSYTIDGFKAVNRKEKNLVIGTPCQIDSFRRYIKRFKVEDNFVLVDFFCHGVPSKLGWNKYLAEIEKTTGKTKNATWRNKDTEWHDSWAVRIDGDKGTSNIRYSQGCTFFYLFLSDSCLGKACYDNCKYKYNHSAADIRLGDLWGKKYSADTKGTSGAVAFTQKGNEILKNLDCTLIEESFETVAEGQIKEPVKRKRLFGTLKKMLENENVTINELHKVLIREIKRKKIIRRIKNPGRTIKNLLKRFIK